MRMRDRYLFSICFYCFAFNNVLHVHSLSESVTVGHSWKSPLNDDYDNDYGKVLNFYSDVPHNVSAKILLSTTTVFLDTTGSCSFNSKPQYTFPFPGFGFGFFTLNRGVKPTWIVGVLLNSKFGDDGVVWYANGDYPVGVNATLSLTTDGNLVLRDGDGSLVWSTNTSGLSVTLMNLTCEGNLVLMNDSGGVVWQSFDHPTDTWLLGQKLRLGQRITFRATATNYSRGFFNGLVTDFGFRAFADTDPPSEYGVSTWSSDTRGKHIFEYLRVQSDGNINTFSYDASLPDNVLNVGGNCYPTTCGSYGVCFSDNTCNCPQDTDANWNYFRAVDQSRPNLGCARVTPLNCQNTEKLQTFLRLENTTYFGIESYPRKFNVDSESCKRACLQNCSCVAAIFHYNAKTSSGDCSLPSQLLTLTHLDPWEFNSTTFIKVQRLDTPPTTNSSFTNEKASPSLLPKLVPSISAGLLFLIALSV